MDFDFQRQNFAEASIIDDNLRPQEIILMGTIIEKVFINNLNTTRSKYNVALRCHLINLAM